ncbi:MAG: CRISPR-associated endonuclease Cas2 [bacterium]|nr:CRISPR-associated endonuclease Cas2 [bacterium]
MPETEFSYIICYDICDDKRRNQVAKCLEGYGDRIQYSVFEARLDEKLYQKMLKDIAQIIETDLDSVHVFRLCANCMLERVAIGLAIGLTPPGTERYWIV